MTLEAGTYLVGSTLGITYVAMKVCQTAVLWRARKALMPDPGILQGVCVYRVQVPERGPANELYCRNFRRSGILTSPKACNGCEDRQLPMPGGKYFDHVQLADVRLLLLRQAWSVFAGLMATALLVMRLSSLMKG